MSDTTVVEIKSAWYSKINWTQAVGLGATVLAVATAGKFNIPPEQQVVLVGVIQGVQSLATWIFRTWFNKSVPPASL